MNGISVAEVGVVGWRGGIGRGDIIEEAEVRKMKDERSRVEPHNV